MSCLPGFRAWCFSALRKNLPPSAVVLLVSLHSHFLCLFLLLEENGKLCLIALGKVPKMILDEVIKAKVLTSDNQRSSIFFVAAFFSPFNVILFICSYPRQ